MKFEVIKIKCDYREKKKKVKQMTRKHRFTITI